LPSSFADREESAAANVNLKEGAALGKELNTDTGQAGSIHDVTQAFYLIACMGRRGECCLIKAVTFILLGQVSFLTWS
jgi:hypothetical protein